MRLLRKSERHVQVLTGRFCQIHSCSEGAVGNLIAVHPKDHHDGPGRGHDGHWGGRRDAGMVVGGILLVILLVVVIGRMRGK